MKWCELREYKWNEYVTIAVNRNLSKCENSPKKKKKPRKTFFSGYFRNCLNCDSLRWSHTHFIFNDAIKLYYVMRCSAMSRYAMRCDVMLCYTIPCDAVLCHVMWTLPLLHWGETVKKRGERKRGNRKIWGTRGGGGGGVAEKVGPMCLNFLSPGSARSWRWLRLKRQICACSDRLANVAQAFSKIVPLTFPSKSDAQQ